MRHLGPALLAAALPAVVAPMLPTSAWSLPALVIIGGLALRERPRTLGFLLLLPAATTRFWEGERVALLLQYAGGPNLVNDLPHHAGALTRSASVVALLGALSMTLLRIPALAPERALALGAGLGGLGATLLHQQAARQMALSPSSSALLETLAAFSPLVVVAAVALQSVRARPPAGILATLAMALWASWAPLRGPAPPQPEGALPRAAPAPTLVAPLAHDAASIADAYPLERAEHGCPESGTFLTQPRRELTVALPADAPAAALESIAEEAPAHWIGRLGILGVAPPLVGPLGPWLRHPAAMLVVGRAPQSAQAADVAQRGAVCTLDALEGSVQQVYDRIRGLSATCAAVVWTPKAARDLGPCPG